MEYDDFIHSLEEINNPDFADSLAANLLPHQTKNIIPQVGYENLLKLILEISKQKGVLWVRRKDFLLAFQDLKSRYEKDHNIILECSLFCRGEDSIRSEIQYRFQDSIHDYMEILDTTDTLKRYTQPMDALLVMTKVFDVIFTFNKKQHKKHHALIYATPEDYGEYLGYTEMELLCISQNLERLNIIEDKAFNELPIVIILI